MLADDFICRLGRFRIAKEILEHRPVALMQHVFAHVVILKAQAIMVDEAVEYLARCQSFEPILDRFAEIPVYEAVFTEKDGKIVEMKWTTT